MVYTCPKPKHYTVFMFTMIAQAAVWVNHQQMTYHSELFYLSGWLFCVMRPHLKTSYTNESMTLFKGPLLTPLDSNLPRGTDTACWWQLLRKSTSEKTPHLKLEWVIMTSADKNDSTSKQSSPFLQILNNYVKQFFNDWLENV